MKKMTMLFCFAFVCFLPSVFCSKNHDYPCKIVCGGKKKIKSLGKGGVREMHSFLNNNGFITVKREEDFFGEGFKRFCIDRLEIRDKDFDVLKEITFPSFDAFSDIVSISKVVVTSPYHFALFYVGRKSNLGMRCMKWGGEKEGIENYCRDCAFGEKCERHWILTPGDYFFMPQGVGFHVCNKKGFRETKDLLAIPGHEILPCSRYPFLVTRLKGRGELFLWHIDIHEKIINRKLIKNIKGASSFAWHQKHPMIFATFGSNSVLLWYIKKNNELKCIGRKVITQRVRPHCLTWGTGEKSTMLYLCYEKNKNQFFRSLECLGIDAFIKKIEQNELFPLEIEMENLMQNFSHVPKNN